MRVQDSDSVVYAVINRGRFHWISVFLWACFSVQAFAAISLHSVVMHAEDKHQTFKGWDGMGMGVQSEAASLF